LFYNNIKLIIINKFYFNKTVAANEFPVPVLFYSFGVLKWNVDELKHPDQGNEEILRPAGVSPHVTRKKGTDELREPTRSRRPGCNCSSPERSRSFDYSD
jgi:hypothetical protein